MNDSQLSQPQSSAKDEKVSSVVLKTLSPEEISSLSKNWTKSEKFLLVQLNQLKEHVNQLATFFQEAFVVIGNQVERQETGLANLAKIVMANQEFSTLITPQIQNTTSIIKELSNQQSLQQTSLSGIHDLILNLQNQVRPSNLEAIQNFKSAANVAQPIIHTEESTAPFPKKEEPSWKSVVLSKKSNTKPASTNKKQLSAAPISGQQQPTQHPLKKVTTVPHHLKSLAKEMAKLTAEEQIQLLVKKDPKVRVPENLEPTYVTCTFQFATKALREPHTAMAILFKQATGIDPLMVSTLSPICGQIFYDPNSLGEEEVHKRLATNSLKITHIDSIISEKDVARLARSYLYGGYFKGLRRAILPDPTSPFLSQVLNLADSLIGVLPITMQHRARRAIEWDRKELIVLPTDEQMT